MRLHVRFVLLCTALAVSGCAWSSQQVNLKPGLMLANSGVGKGRSVYVTVDDERPNQILGHKVPVGGGEITAVQDPAVVVRDALTSGLTQLGFQIAPQPSTSVPALDVELRAIDYKVTQGFWSGGLYVDVAMKGICKLGDVARYDALYRGNHTENIQVVQSQEANEGYINDALSQAINAALRDPQLLDCLAGRPAVAANVGDPGHVE